MIKPIVKKVKACGQNEDFETISFWLRKSPEERMNAMGELYIQQLLIRGYKEMPHIKKTVSRRKISQ